jgi:hypothetical protein
MVLLAVPVNGAAVAVISLPPQKLLRTAIPARKEINFKLLSTSIITSVLEL